jgi:hypothetical protein
LGELLGVNFRDQCRRQDLNLHPKLIGPAPQAGLSPTAWHWKSVAMTLKTAGF